MDNKIQADSQGFLIGEKQLKEINQGVDKTQANTAEILEVLKAQILKFQQIYSTEAKRRDRPIKNTGKDQSEAQPITTRSTSQPRIPPPIDTRDTTRRSDAINPRTDSHEEQHTSQPKNRRNRTNNTADSSNTSNNRERDSRGRFVSDKDRSITDRIKDGFNQSNLGLNANTSGVDPNLDALHELTGLFKPAGRAFKFMGRGASFLFKRNKTGRNADLPREQSEHYDEIERNQTEERKVLRKILDAILKQSRGGLTSLLGSMGGFLDGNGDRRRRRGRRGRGRPPIPTPSSDASRSPRTEGRTSKILKGAGKLAKGAVKRIPFVGTAIEAGMLAKDWDKSSSGDKGAGIGSMVGTGIGGALGSFLGPVGTVAGAALGGYVGDTVGRSVGDWTDSLEAQDIGKSIVSGWDSTLDSITSLVNKGLDTVGLSKEKKPEWDSIRDNLKSIRLPNGLNLKYKPFNPNQPLTPNYVYKNPLSANSEQSGAYRPSPLDPNKSAVSSIPPTSVSLPTKNTDNQRMVLQSMLNAGFSESQALAMTAEVGRENNFSSKNLFGTHSDAANRKTNLGMFSWQGDERAGKLYKYLDSQGLIKDGKMIPGQATLDAQARFAKQEIETDPRYAPTKKMFASNPNADPETYAKTLGTNYVRWAYGQNKLKSGASFDWLSHDRRRSGHLGTSQKILPSLRKTNIPPMLAKTPNNTNSLMPSATQSPRVQRIPAIQYPPIPKQQKQEQKPQAPLMIGNNMPMPTQNLGDRDMAHIVTGGIGATGIPFR